MSAYPDDRRRECWRCGSHGRVHRYAVGEDVRDLCWDCRVAMGKRAVPRQERAQAPSMSAA